MKIKFLVDSYQSSTESFCSLKIFNNKQEKYSIQKCVDKNMTFIFDLDKNSTIDFVITNKNTQHTIVENNKIVKDTFLLIKKISLNEFDLLPKINLFSNYFTENCGVLRTNGYMNYNGTYRFKFRYPHGRHVLLCKYYNPKL